MSHALSVSKSDETFADRLRSALGSRSAASLAREAKIAPASLQRYFEGSMPGADIAFRLARALQVEPAWLIEGSGPALAGVREPTHLISVDEADWLQLPRYDLFRITPTDRGDPVETVPIRRDWIARAVRTTTGLWLADMPSDAMPAVAREGDTIICQDVRPPLADGRIYVLLLDGRPVVRRVQVHPEGLRLSADNPNFDPILVTPDRLDQVSPVGRVLGAIALHAV